MGATPTRAKEDEYKMERGRQEGPSHPVQLFDPPFEVLEPKHLSAPIVYNSPHSGRIYPPEFLRRTKLDPLSLRRSEDCYVDELVEQVVDLGLPLVRANFPRAYLDVNREPYELDPLMFADPLPDYVNTGSARVAGGLGTIARVVSEAEEIYHEPLTFAEAETRILSLHVPYHRTLANIFSAVRQQFGTALLIDCHSMPSIIAGPGSTESVARPDFVLGDRYGASCAGQIVDFFERLLQRLGYTVMRNKPYAGGFITQSYGRPAESSHALQLEISRALYLDEETLERHAGFDRLRDDLTTVAAELIAALPDLIQPTRCAAE